MNVCTIYSGYYFTCRFIASDVIGKEQFSNLCIFDTYTYYEVISYCTDGYCISPSILYPGYSTCGALSNEVVLKRIGKDPVTSNCVQAEEGVVNPAK